MKREEEKVKREEEAGKNKQMMSGGQGGGESGGGADGFYAEAYPGMEVNDAIDDSDEEADYTKMDLVSA